MHACEQADARLMEGVSDDDVRDVWSRACPPLDPHPDPRSALAAVKEALKVACGELAGEALGSLHRRACPHPALHSLFLSIFSHFPFNDSQQ